MKEAFDLGAELLLGMLRRVLDIPVVVKAGCHDIEADDPAHEAYQKRLPDFGESGLQGLQQSLARKTKHQAEARHRKVKVAGGVFKRDRM